MNVFICHSARPSLPRSLHERWREKGDCSLGLGVKLSSWDSSHTDQTGAPAVSWESYSFEWCIDLMQIWRLLISIN